MAEMLDVQARVYNWKYVVQYVYVAVVGNTAWLRLHAQLGTVTLYISLPLTPGVIHMMLRPMG